MSFSSLSPYLLTLAVIASTQPVYATEPPKAEHQERAKASSLATFNGIAYGVIDFISDDRRRISVRPIRQANSKNSKRLRSTTYIVDKKTVFKREKKAVTRKSLKIGQRVAVRFFGEGDIIIAEAVFLVKGEFVPSDYQKSPPKAAAAESAPAKH